MAGCSQRGGHLSSDVTFCVKIVGTNLLYICKAKTFWGLTITNILQNIEYPAQESYEKVNFYDFGGLNYVT